MRRPLAVLLVGMGLVGIATCAGKRNANERFAIAAKAVDADCRAYRSQPRHRNSEVCRHDQYSPKAVPLYAEARDLVNRAEASMARGDRDAAGHALGRAIGLVEDIVRVGSSIAMLARASLVDEILDLGEKHPALDVVRLLEGTSLPSEHPFEREQLEHRWQLAHWNELEIAYQHKTENRSPSDLATALEEYGSAYARMEDALVKHHDVGECETIAKGGSGDLGAAVMMCQTFNRYLATAARLDAARHRGLSSATR